MTLIEVAKQAAAPDPRPSCANSAPQGQIFDAPNAHRSRTFGRAIQRRLNGKSGRFCLSRVRARRLATMKTAIFKQVHWSRSCLPFVVMNFGAVSVVNGVQSRAIAAKATYAALAFDLKPCLAPGERAAIVILSAAQPIHKVYSYILGNFQSIALFRPYLKNITADTIGFQQRHRYRDSNRGFQHHSRRTTWLAICDELAFFYSRKLCEP